MKKLALYTLLGAFGFTLASCNEDFEDWAAPQTNPQEEALVISGISAQAIDQVSLDTEDPAVQVVSMPEVSLPEGFSIKNLRVSFTSEGSAKTDATELSGETSKIEDPDATYDVMGFINTEKMQAMFEEYWGTDITSRVFQAQVFVDAIKDGEALLVDAGTVNVTITPSQLKFSEEGAIIPDPILWLTGNNYGWGSTWVPLVPVCDQWDNDPDKTAFMNDMSWIIIYLEADEEFKFAPQEGWGNDFGMSAEVISEVGDVFDASSTDNIKMTQSGWYLLRVKNTDGKRQVVFKEPNVYLIGNTSPASWACDESGLFNVPAKSDGIFVSPKFIKDDEVRVCVDLGDGIDWWRSEFIPIDGRISYRGNDGDQERVAVTAGQKAYFKFSIGGGLVK